MSVLKMVGVLPGSSALADQGLAGVNLAQYLRSDLAHDGGPLADLVSTFRRVATLPPSDGGGQSENVLNTSLSVHHSRQGGLRSPLFIAQGQRWHEKQRGVSVLMPRSPSTHDVVGYDGKSLRVYLNPSERTMVVGPSTFALAASQMSDLTNTVMELSQAIARLPDDAGPTQLLGVIEESGIPVHLALRGTDWGKFLATAELQYRMALLDI